MAFTHLCNVQLIFSNKHDRYVHVSEDGGSKLVKRMQHIAHKALRNQQKLKGQFHQHDKLAAPA